MYQVQYRCIYRDHWYDHAEAASWSMAVHYAATLERSGRIARILDPFGRIVYREGNITC